jgi:sialate O-acetylesterase
MPLDFMHLKSTCLILLSCGALLRADVTLAPLFTDHAVLQQGKPIPVWGTAQPGESVTVDFHDDRETTRADANGRWRIDLKPLHADDRPAELKVSAKNTIVVRDILVGEVWLASGQSNMEFKLRSSQGGAEAIAAANLPLIRHIRLAHQVADEPTGTSRGEWQVTTPETAPDYTAVGFYFAREISQTIKTPVGIIHNSWGGTPIESWMSTESLASDPDFKVVGERWAKALAQYPDKKAKYDDDLAAWTREQAAAKAAGKEFSKRKPDAPGGPGHRYTPSGLYNGMIYPLAPYALRGVIWYQGENNASRAVEYRKLFPALIHGWRESFGQGDIPFYWVQLANYESPYGGPDSWAFLREAQDRALALPNTGQAVTIDLGDPTNIHPKNKSDVGHRLALVALTRTYRQSGEFSGPRFESLMVEGDSMRVRLSHATGLIVRGEAPPMFELAGPDKRFVPAAVRIEDEMLVVTATGVSNPVAVRYAWRNNPLANVYNGAGLPLVPFRSDSW